MNNNDDHVREIIKLYQQHGDIGRISQQMNDRGISHQEVMQVIIPYRLRQRNRYLLGLMASLIGGTLAFWFLYEILKSTDRFVPTLAGIGVGLYGIGLGCLYRIVVHPR